jgi:hypothetical protein
MDDPIASGGNVLPGRKITYRLAIRQVGLIDIVPFFSTQERSSRASELIIADYLAVVPATEQAIDPLVHRGPDKVD